VIEIYPAHSKGLLVHRKPLLMWIGRPVLEIRWLNNKFICFLGEFRKFSAHVRTSSGSFAGSERAFLLSAAIEGVCPLRGTSALGSVSNPAYSCSCSRLLPAYAVVLESPLV
jgi:hypothetical protein